MSSYITTTEFRAISIAPTRIIDAVEAASAGFLAAQIELASDDIDARLRKRYAAPFASAPRKVRRWVAAIVTRELLLKHGIDPTDSQWGAYDAAATRALEELKEAADSVEGLFDLPLATSSATAIVAPRPITYTESSPYVHQDVQVSEAYDEDRAGSGTYG